MNVHSFRTPGLGDQSYLFTHDGIGVLVDPQRDSERFLTAVEEHGVDLAFILDTHLHNDYVSGGPEIARRTGAKLVLPASAAPAYDHTAAYHMEEIDGPGFSIRPIHTPGHTPEHTSYVIIIDGKPVAVFSGGSLLVGSAGRPDLLGPERARTLGKLQHRSVNRLAEFDDDVELFPTHGAGSFCTVTGAGEYTSTIGKERDTNPLLQLDTPDEMADYLLKTPMPIPAFYQYMGPANTFGFPEARVGLPPLLEVGALKNMPWDTLIVDIRDRRTQASGTIAGSLTVELTDDFGSWTAWLGEHDAPIVLVADEGNDDAVVTAVTQLAQVGVDDVRGVITDLTGAELVTFDVLELDDFVAAVNADEHGQLLDVRQTNETEENPVNGAIAQFLGDFVHVGVPESLDSSKRVFTFCGSGRRASIAASILMDDGFDVVVLTDAGGTELRAKLA